MEKNLPFHQDNPAELTYVKTITASFSSYKHSYSTTALNYTKAV